MQVKTILNRIQKQPGFVYGKIHVGMIGKFEALLVEIEPDGRVQATCSVCGDRCSGYDRLPQRRFEFIPLWGVKVFFLYALRRLNCPRCGIKVEAIPWAEGKSPLTTAYCWFLARWARRLSWKEVGEVFGMSWDSVVRSVRLAVEWGLKNRSLEGIRAIGIDEIAWHKGHNYATLVYQIDARTKRLLWIGRERTQKTLQAFFTWFGPSHNCALQFVCSDLWKPYLQVIAHNANHALNILDRFHIMSRMGKAIDEVRAKEVKELKANGQDPVLTKSRWCLLKRPINLTAGQRLKLKDLLRCNLKTVRAYLLKEDFQWFWTYVSPAWAGKFLDTWCSQAMRSRIKPMKSVAKMLRSHRKLLLNWFCAKKQIIALGAVEGLNNKAKLTMKRAYGFRNFDLLKLALYHTMGNLPEPYTTHKFC